MFSVCVCSLRYPARNAHAPYCHLWPAPLYNIFPHYLINRTIFGKQLLNTKCVLIFSTAFVWNISHSRNNWGRYDQKCISGFMYACQISIQPEYSWQIFEKYTNMKFNVNPFVGSWVVPCGRMIRRTDGRTDRETGRYDGTTSSISQFFGRPYKLMCYCHIFCLPVKFGTLLSCYCLLSSYCSFDLYCPYCVNDCTVQLL